MEQAADIVLLVFAQGNKKITKEETITSDGRYNSALTFISWQECAAESPLRAVLETLNNGISGNVGTIFCG